MHITKEQEDFIKSRIVRKKGVLGYSREVLPKITKGKVSSTDAIVIYVAKKIRPEELSSNDLVESEIEGVATDIRELGSMPVPEDA